MLTENRFFGEMSIEKNDFLFHGGTIVINVGFSSKFLASMGEGVSQLSTHLE